MPSKEFKKYRVSREDGSNPAIVEVELRSPLTKRLRRQIDKVVELPDGRKRLDQEWVEFDHPYDVESEMKEDAIRAYNQSGGAGKETAFAARHLRIEAIGPSHQEQERPASRKREPELVKV